MAAEQSPGEAEGEAASAGLCFLCRPAAPVLRIVPEGEKLQLASYWPAATWHLRASRISFTTLCRVLANGLV